MQKERKRVRKKRGLWYWLVKRERFCNWKVREKELNSCIHYPQTHSICCTPPKLLDRQSCTCTHTLKGRESIEKGDSLSVFCMSIRMENYCWWLLMRVLNGVGWKWGEKTFLFFYLYVSSSSIHPHSFYLCSSLSLLQLPPFLFYFYFELLCFNGACWWPHNRSL